LIATSLNLLFVCSRNQWRSPTAERIFRRDQYNTRSAGTAGSAKTKLSEKLILWADVIFVMEKRHKSIIQERFGDVVEDKELIILSIPDEYQYMDEELIELLEASVNPHL
jgi:predicted protein tyrosine phosphatase